MSEDIISEIDNLAKKMSQLRKQKKELDEQKKRSKSEDSAYDYIKEAYFKSKGSVEIGSNKENLSEFIHGLAIEFADTRECSYPKEHIVENIRRLIRERQTELEEKIYFLQNECIINDKFGKLLKEKIDSNKLWELKWT